MTASVRNAFRNQAGSCRHLGSPLTAQICDTLAEVLSPGQGRVARRVLDWPGDPSSHADSVPLRLCGGLHAMVLTGAAPHLARAYAAGGVTAEQLLAALHEHEVSLLEWLDRPPQTNEVGRSAALIAAARFLSAQSPLPLRLLELGASAGLNLNFDHYHLGPARQGVALTPDWRGTVPKAMVQVRSRRGVDLNPLDPNRDALRLMAYCWADQTARMSRLRGALDIARTDPPPVDRGDAGEWLVGQLDAPAPGVVTMVFHTVAAQYFPPATARACADALASAASWASPQAPLAHVQMEADGGEGAALSLSFWDGSARHWSLGRADFHGRWIAWDPRPA